MIITGKMMAISIAATPRTSAANFRALRLRLAAPDMKRLCRPLLI
jgi:hypothetical protein